ncbi:DNA polymerase III subunit epsilon [Caulobacter vibrioides]|uniref:DNA polymerase III subunit epsilon n=2 Tax=Caulobacter vibrioides TaxID=155892 RepID=Q9AC56_CAUVC|nr:DNA polymerase III subunit epsilon [Caulobacter vibrioides]YP_002515380.1 DNA polymerase III, epsilon chain [Caulobacter vibrioides NA1000]QBQ56822.1 DNA polymerase III subunit epsilon [synthetic Caulobacter sp. 'ethensis']AAK21993.1 DNA polymerase III, epsilon subunit [Caulobacter vibrioides CB15]ACL93472.1 DNA polymerase III, epsilon chain [Caulobacter vibrioides NA1000]ATC23028.1 DNA polymerase III subunit epsilon [Caulobacter vibrioides]ATC26843.1 DNA polymerase III subunit epsilon [Ca
MAREIILDTETTGFDPKTGDRLVEIGCIEVVDFMPTGRSFHEYCDPLRDMPAEAEKVHGLSSAFLTGKPKFHEIADRFLDFVGDSVVVAHNAAFDRQFVNFELEKCGKAPIHEERWVDTLAMAKKRFPGMYNSLDALCKRFKISLESRDKHGALIDAHLLAEVYLELQGGKERALELTHSTGAMAVSTAIQGVYAARSRPLAPRSTDAEREIHAAWVRKNLKDKALWIQFGVVAAEA